MSDALKQCRQLFAAIFEPDDVIEFRTLKQVAKRWTRADDIGSAIEELERFNAAGRHCYFGANPRIGQTAAPPHEARWLPYAMPVYADFDGGVPRCRRRTPSGSQRAGLPDADGGRDHPAAASIACWRLDQPLSRCTAARPAAPAGSRSRLLASDDGRHVGMSSHASCGCLAW
jgi:hypothetical protein